MTIEVELELAELCHKKAIAHIRLALRELENNYRGDVQRRAALEWLQIADALRTRTASSGEDV